MKRTDLAVEARELWEESAKETTQLSGVKAQRIKREGYPVTRVEVLNHQGEEALGKPIGTYLTLDLSDYWQRRPGFFERAVRLIGAELKDMIPTEGPVLVVGLGNPDMTPDSVGPLTVNSILVTRHLLSAMPKQFAGFRDVSVFRTGVLGTTGIESAEAVRGLSEQTKPKLVIAIDALAARRLNRVCATVQISDTGIVPGSGVGNHRYALNRDTLGIPVIAIGVPTVVDGATLAADLLEESGVSEMVPAKIHGKQLFVTPREVDVQVRDLSKLIAYGINWAIQELDVADINALLS